MDRLKECIQSIKSNPRLKSFDEAETKQAVILKILNLLGWDTFNVDEVKPEVAIGGRRVDFSLRDHQKNKVFIEVKKTGEELENHQDQLLDYSFKEGVKLAVLTNGITWWFYLPLNEGSWEERKFYIIDCEQQEEDIIAKKFFCFLDKDEVVSGRAIKNAEKIHENKQTRNTILNNIPNAWNRLIENKDDVLIDLLRETTEKMCGFKVDNTAVEDFLRQQKNIILIPPNIPNEKTSKKITRLNKTSSNNYSDYTNRSIKSFTFKGKVFEVSKFSDLLLELCSNLNKIHGAEFLKVLNLRGRKRPNFSKNKNELREPKKIPQTDIYAETNRSAQNCVDFAFKLVDFFGHKRDELKINVH
jgi:predicted type IV restriction endonuclease